MTILISVFAILAFCVILAAVIATRLTESKQLDGYRHPDQIQPYWITDHSNASTGPPGMSWLLLVMVAFVALLMMVVLVTVAA